MLEVVEVDAGQRHDTQIAIGARFAVHVARERILVALVAPRHKRGEAVRFVLECARHLEVLDDVVVVFDVAVHHGGRGAHAGVVRGAVHVDPVLGGGLGPQLRNLFLHPVAQNLRAAARNRAQAGFIEFGDDLVQRKPGHFGHLHDFGRRVEVCVNVREALARFAHQIEVVLERNCVVEAALEQHGGDAFFARVRELVHHLFNGIGVLALLAGCAIERAERAVSVARVGVIEIGVNDERDFGLGVVVPAPRHRERCELEERRVAQEIKSFRARDALAVLHFVANDI